MLSAAYSQHTIPDTACSGGGEGGDVTGWRGDKGKDGGVEGKGTER